MMTLIFTTIAGLVHIYIFCLESLFWGHPKTNRVFRMPSELAEANRLFAFNQGFYNLFLGTAAIGGLFVGVDNAIGKTLVGYALLSMVLAGTVLIISNSKLLRPALVQGIPPLVGLVFLVIH